MSLDDYGFTDYVITGDPHMLDNDIQRSGIYKQTLRDRQEEIRKLDELGRRLKVGDNHATV